MASLKNGVSKDYAIMNNKIHTTQMIEFPKIASSARSSLSYQEQVKLYFYDKKIQMKKALEQDVRLNEISQDILSLNDTSLLFNSFRRVMEVIKEVSQYRTQGGRRSNPIQNNCTTVKNKKNAKLNRRSNSNPQNNEGDEDQNNQNLNESINLDSTLNTTIIKQQLEDVDSSMIYQHHNPHDHQISPPESNSTSLEKSSILKPNEFVAIEMQSTTESIAKDPKTKTDFQKSHLSNINDDIKSDATFQDFLISCFNVMDSFDSAGLALSDIFTNFNPDVQFELFKQFFVNLEQWGSITPQSYAVSKNLNTFGLKKYGLVKLKQTIKKFHSMIGQHKTDGHYYFEKLMNQDFTTICNKLNIIKEKLSRGLADQMRIKDDIEICLSNREEKDSEQKQSNTLAKQQYCYSGKDQQLENQIGFLLPLDCGHNGLYDEEELKILQFHLQRSGFCS